MLSDEEKLKARIKSNVEKVVTKKGLSPCWIWKGTFAGKGYPVFKIGKRRVSVRRLAFLLYRKTNPGRLSLWSKCSCPDCVNPNHLEVNSRRKGGRPKEK